MKDVNQSKTIESPKPSKRGNTRFDSSITRKEVPSLKSNFRAHVESLLCLMKAQSRLQTNADLVSLPACQCVSCQCQGGHLPGSRLAHARGGPPVAQDQRLIDCHRLKSHTNSCHQGAQLVPGFRSGSKSTTPTKAQFGPITG